MLRMDPRAYQSTPLSSIFSMQTEFTTGTPRNALDEPPPVALANNNLVLLVFLRVDVVVHLDPQAGLG
jgi:hypothetical protein